jgi:membrane-associated protein
MSFNVIGGVAWVTICVVAGRLFGGTEVVEKHFSLVVLVIVALSLVPAVVEVIRARRRPPS